MAHRSAPTKCGRAGKARLDLDAVRDARPTFATPGARRRTRSQARARTGTNASGGARIRQARRVRAPRLRPTCRSDARRRRVATMKQRSPPSRRTSRPAAPREIALEAIDRGRAGDGRRLGRPHRLQQHPPQGHGGDHRRPISRGRFIHYGIREHGMAAAMNGMALHGGIIPYSAAPSWCSPTIAGRRSGWRR